MPDDPYALNEPIRLTRRFAIICAAVVCVAGAVLAYHQQATAIDQLERMAERNNIGLTTAFGNSIWPRFFRFIDQAHRLNPEEIRRHPRTPELHAAVAALMAGTSVLKVKIYDIRGMTAFSTDPSQIGLDYSDNPRLLAALRNGSASELEFRETFNAFSGPLRDRYVLSSYIPVRPGGGSNAIEGVVEIYSDVTDFHAYVGRRGTTQIVVVAIAFLIVFALLLIAVWYAERLIRRHHERGLELTRNVSKAEAASRAKSEFMANMSHELRTPLNAVIGFSSILQSEPQGPLGAPEYGKFVAAIHDGGLHLLDVIDDVLQLAETESGKIEFNAESVDPTALVGSVCQFLSDRANKKDISLVTDFPADMPEIRSDPLKLRQIVLNLLSNAVKFTPPGGKVTLRLAAADDSIVITVSDSGIGIRAEDIPLAFAPFGQVDGSLSREHEGTGLGLPLSLKLAEAFGGLLKMVSAPGEGTSVRVVLPVAGPTDTADQSTHADAAVATAA